MKNQYRTLRLPPTSHISNLIADLTGKSNYKPISQSHCHAHPPNDPKGVFNMGFKNTV